jgi:hypothetical protein
MTRIVTTHYRYKPPPKRKQPVALEVPEVVKTADPVKAHTSVRPAPKQPPPANDDGPTEPARRPAARKPAIVSARKPGKRYISAPDLPPEELQRRTDAAAALFREIKRRITAKPAKGRSD